MHSDLCDAWRARFIEALGLRGGSSPDSAITHAIERSDGIDLYRAWVRLGLDGIAFRGQFRAVPTDNQTLPSGT